MRNPFSTFWLSVLICSFHIISGCSNSSINSSDPITDEKPSERGYAGTFGGSADDIGKSILETADGGLFISGTTRSTDGDFSGLNRGNRDVFAIKITAGGSPAFINTYGGTNSDWAMDSAEDAAGNLYITGYSRSDDQQFSQQNRGENDLFLMKIAPNGSLIWAITYGGSDEDYGYALEIVNEHIYVAGATRSTDLVASNKNGTDKDIFILKTDLNGEVKWMQTFGSSGNDEALSITYNQSGNIAVTGFFESGDGLFDGAQPGIFGAYVIKLDDEGTIKRVKTFSGSDTDIGQTIYATSENGYIIGGESNSIDSDFSVLTAGGKNGFLLKVNENLEPLWLLTASGSETDEVHSVYPVNEHLWAAVGETRSGDFLSVTPLFEGLNAFVILFNSDGVIQETQVFGGSRSDIALDVVTLTSGDIAISGWTISNDGPFSGSIRASLDTYFLLFNPENLGAIPVE